MGNISHFGCKKLLVNFEQAGYYTWPMLWLLDASIHTVYCTNARCICDIVTKRTGIQKERHPTERSVCVGGLAADADS